jgi:hypothetical protein
MEMKGVVEKIVMRYDLRFFHDPLRRRCRGDADRIV